MKKLCLLVCALLCVIVLIVSCGEGGVASSTGGASTTESAVTTAQVTVGQTVADTTEAATLGSTSETTAQIAVVTTLETTAQTVVVTTVETTAGLLELIDGDEPVFQVVSSLEMFKSDFFSKQINEFCIAIREIGVTKPNYVYDQGRKMTYEILIGKTNRDVKIPVLEDLEWVVMVQGTKVIIDSATDYGLLDALEYFKTTYLSERNKTLTLPTNLCKIGKHDLVTSDEHNMTYAEMASKTMDAFNDAFWNKKGIDIGFWEAAEIIEIYADAYELTKDEAIKEKLLSFADYFMLVNKQDWLWKNHNDSPMWACIAFSRITLLTGKTKYYEVAKKNFDAVYERSYDLTLGGGLYWDTDKTTKNACVNCPASIAAYYIAQISGDTSYYEKAKDLMDWTIENLYEKYTGKVYGASNIYGTTTESASTYNQGTFIGACTMLYQIYKDETYLAYAQKATEYAMLYLTDSTYGVLDNRENGDNAALGFKGIFVRWARYYANVTNNVNIVLFLQYNADVAYGHRNENGLIWTNWCTQTPADPVAEKHNAFSMCTALSLFYNCQLWQ